LFFCSRKCKEYAQSLAGGCKEIQPAHYGTGSGLEQYRNNAFCEYGKVCCDCKEAREHLLQVHHIDGVRVHNDIKNLEVVCPTCHVRRHLRLLDGRWVMDFRGLTPREMLQSL
jgi:5-methylcytosine-specific restriction endonuclease McrA